MLMRSISEVAPGTGFGVLTAYATFPLPLAISVAEAMRGCSVPFG